jgi:hypothetical protein
MAIGLRGALAGALIVSASGCMSYRGPHGVESALEHKMGAELHRELGIKLGPISTKFAASFVGHDDDFDLHGMTSVGFAVFEVGARNGDAPRPIEPKDLGARGWSTVLDSRDGGEQVLLLVKPRNGSIHDMMFLAVDADEVVVARLTGDLDRLIEKAIDGAHRDGAHGARAAIGVGAD